MTYLSAKNAGFEGSYSDWVDAGRPEESNNVASNVATNLGSLTWKDHNDVSQTMSFDQVIQSAMEKASAEGQAGTNRINQYMGLPLDIFNDRRGDNYWQGGIDYDKFDDPAQAKAKIDAIMEINQEIAQKSNEAYSNAKSAYGKWNHQDARKMFQKEMQDLSTELPEIKSVVTQELTQEINKLNETGEFGLNPRTGEPMTKTQAYNLAKQADPGMKFDDFDKNPAPFMEKAGINMRDVAVSGDQGTIQDQNQTGVPYPTWAEQQRTSGQPASYQDWLAAKEAGTLGAETTPDGSTPGSPEGVDTSSDEVGLETLVNSPYYQNLPPDEQSLVKMTLLGWKPGQEINMDNIIGEFNKIKNETVNPKFAEKIDVFTSDVLNQYDQLKASRGQELEVERANEGSNIRQARSDLERRGMTFAGQGIEQLGAKAAIGRTDGAIPTQTEVGATEDLTTKGGMTFEDGKFFEGNVNQQSRLMGTASKQRYQQNVRNLGRQAEQALGAGVSGLGIEGFAPAGTQVGSFEAQKKQELGNILGGIQGKYALANKQNDPVANNFKL